MTSQKKNTITELCRLISKRGIASRKVASEYIQAGKVRVNGKIQRNPRVGVNLKSIIEIEGVDSSKRKKSVFMMNKKRGVITTRLDEKNRETVYSHPGLKGNWLAPVGRLDKASEGLLLFTNDNKLADALTAPDKHLEKVYHVQIKGEITSEQLDQLSNGILIDKVMTAKSSWKIIKNSEINSWLEVVLKEGRNRQIRKMLETFGIEVVRLVRVKIGDLELGELAKGEMRELSASEVSALRTKIRDSV